MNRKQRRAQSSVSPAMGRKFVALTGVTAGGLVASGFASALPAQAATITAANCTQANTQLVAIQSTGGTLNLNFSGNCLLDQSYTLSHDTIIHGPANSGLTLKVKDSNFQAFNTGSSLTLSNLQFANVTPAHTVTSFVFGAANSTLAINDVEFHDADVNSGAIYVEGHIEVTHSKFFNLTSSSLSSAIYMYTGASGSIASSSFTNNTSAATSWGAIGINGSNVDISDSQFSHNTTAGTGGAITNFSGSDVNVNRSTFTGNTAQNNGGAIYSVGGALTVNDSQFDSNLAHDGFGGAIYSEGAVTLKNSTFFNNKASQAGGAIDVVYNSADVDNSTFVGNQATNAAAMFSEGGIVSNSTFWNNSTVGSSTGVGSISIPGGAYFGNILANSDATPVMESGNTDLGANLYTDDSFVKTTAGVGASKRVTLASLKLKALALNKTSPSNSGATKTVALQSGSSALDYYTGAAAGITPAYNSVSRLAGKDQRGVARPISGKYDVGAFEFELPIVTGAQETILFRGDSAQLSVHAKAQLRALASKMMSDNLHSIRLEGHTATTTNASPLGRIFRDKLARARTLAVSKYLVAEFKKHNYSVKIKQVTKAAANPAASNKTESGRKANRRVIISVK